MGECGESLLTQERLEGCAAGLESILEGEDLTFQSNSVGRKNIVDRTNVFPRGINLEHILAIIIVCPSCETDLHHEKSAFLKCPKCRRRWKIGLQEQ